MPIIAEMRIIDGYVWVRSPFPNIESGSAWWTPKEQQANYKEGWNDCLKERQTKLTKWSEESVERVAKTLFKQESKVADHNGGEVHLRWEMIGEVWRDQLLGDAKAALSVIAELSEIKGEGT